MTPEEMLGRIADLETALRIVIVIWVVTIVMLRLLPTGECDSKCERCSIYRNTDICPMCFTRHDRKERCQ